MSRRLLERIRDHATGLDQAAPPIRLDDVRAPSRHESERGPRRILGLAAAALLIVGGLVAIYGVGAPGRQPSAVLPSTSGPTAAPDTSLVAPKSEQTTTTVGPTTTIDREALNATWPLSGNWLIHEPTVRPTVNEAGPEALGFVVFSVQTDGDRYVSVGHGQCFTHGGRVVEINALTQIKPIDGAAEPAVECDPGPPTQVFIDVVDCLQTGCHLALESGVLDLTNTAGDRIGRLTRAAGDVP